MWHLLCNNVHKQVHHFYVPQGNHLLRSNSANVSFFPLFKACLHIHLLSVCRGQGGSFGSWLQCYDVKTELNAATSVIWLKQQKKGGGLLNFIYRCFEPVPPFIVSLTAAKKKFLRYSPPTPGDAIKKPLCDCLMSLCSTPACWRWLRVYQRPQRTTAWYRFTQETAWCELHCNEVRTFKDSSMRFEWSFLVLFITKYIEMYV